MDYDEPDRVAPQLQTDRRSAPTYDTLTLSRFSAGARISASGASEPVLSGLSPTSAAYRMTLLQELEKLGSLANLENRTGKRAEQEREFTMAALRRCQTVQTRRTDPGTSAGPGIASPRHLVQLIQSVNADPVMRSLTRSLSRSAPGDRVPMTAPMPIHEEGEEEAEAEVAAPPQEAVEELLPSALAHITVDPSDVEPPGTVLPLVEEETMVVMEEVRSSYNGRTSRLARMTSRRVSDAGQSIIVVSVPHSLSSQVSVSTSNIRSTFESAADSAVASADQADTDESERPSFTKSNTPRNPWAPLPGPPMSDGMVAKRVIETPPSLQTMDSFKIPTIR